MNILYLRYALEVAQAGSINKAAKKLFIGQPNLSRAIRDLEETFDITIFNRTPQGMVVTEPGQRFLQRAQSILQQLDDLKSASSGSTGGVFSISVPHASYISDAFIHFCEAIQPSRDKVIYVGTTSDRAIQNVLEYNYGLGIIRYAVHYDSYFQELLQEKELISEPIAEFPYILIMSRLHPLVAKEKVICSDLSRYIEVAHRDQYVPRLEREEYLKNEQPGNVSRRVFVCERASQLELLSSNSDSYMWDAPLPERLLSRYELVEKPCQDNKRIYRDVLIQRRDYQRTRLDDLFIDELKTSKSKYL